MTGQITPQTPDGELVQWARAGDLDAFEKHLAGCNPCQVVVDNIRKTITLYKAGQAYELSASFRAKLHAALCRKWKEQHHKV